MTGVTRAENGSVLAALAGQVATFPELLAAMTNSSDLLAALDEPQRARLQVRPPADRLLAASDALLINSRRAAPCAAPPG